MKGIKEYFRKLENIFTAAAFAEEGEFDTARELMKEETHMGRKDATRVVANLHTGVRTS